MVSVARPLRWWRSCHGGDIHIIAAIIPIRLRRSRRLILARRRGELFDNDDDGACETNLHAVPRPSSRPCYVITKYNDGGIWYRCEEQQ